MKPGKLSDYTNLAADFGTLFAIALLSPCSTFQEFGSVPTRNVEVLIHSPSATQSLARLQGLEKLLPEVLLRQGDIVVATLRTPSVLEPLTKQYPPSQLFVLALDVTRPSDISAAFARTENVFGRLDVVFNNAGYGIFGEVESVPDAEARALFEVNFWGVVGVSREAVKFSREVNPPGEGGILPQHSSMMAFVGGLGGSFYCANKHAIDGFSESLSKELPREWNIKASLVLISSTPGSGIFTLKQICVLQTGGFDANTTAASKILPTHPAYADTPTAALREARHEAAFDGDPHKFADMLHQLVGSIDKGKKTPLFFPIGEDALDRLRVRLGKMAKLVEDVAPWSMGLKKDHDRTKARLRGHG